MNYYYTLNYIVVGDSGVGKSCLILNFIGQSFRVEHAATIGIDFGSKMVNSYGKKFKLLIWDTAGQETFNSISRSYYRGAVGALLVYDVTNQESFFNIKKWMDEIKEYGDSHVSFILVGNKTDLVDKRVVSFEEGQKFAKEHDMLFIESSAKSGNNVDQAFLKALERINDNLDKGLIKAKKLQDHHRIEENNFSQQSERKCAC